MAEEKLYSAREASHYGIRKLEDGFLVVGDEYMGETLRAFSTPEQLIDWLSRELECGPIVWGLTLEAWKAEAGIKPEDLVPIPDPSVDLLGFREAVESNAAFLLEFFVRQELEKQKPPTPPKPKKKKAKKPEEEKPKKEGKEE